MSRIDELKKQHPQFNISYLDIFKRLDISKTGKYMPIISHAVNEIVNKRLSYKNEINAVKSRCDEYGFNYDGLNDYELTTSFTILDYVIGKDWDIVREFMDYMERGVIENKDVLTYKNMEDVKAAVSTATIKMYSKELESQVHKEFEDDTWVALRPLSFEASSRYGSSTKWCTTYKKEKEYFAKYFSRGVLVYFINKITGYKFALYSEVYDINNEISFWNAEDRRVDFLELDIEPYLLPIIKNLAMSKIKNSDMLSLDDLQKVLVDCQYFRLDGEIGELHAVPHDENELAPPPLSMAYARETAGYVIDGPDVPTLASLEGSQAGIIYIPGELSNRLIGMDTGEGEVGDYRRDDGYVMYGNPPVGTLEIDGRDYPLQIRG